MVGLFFALAYAGYQHFALHTNDSLTYSSAMTFLFNWYIWTSVVIGVFTVGFAFVVTFLGEEAGAAAGGFVGRTLGFLGGAALSALMIAVTIASRGSLIAGSWLLTQAMVLSTDGLPVWDNTKLAFGGLLLLVGVILGRSSSSSSSSSSHNG